MSDVLVIGFAGLACSLVYRIPQLYKIYTTKQASDISPWMIHIQNMSYAFYIWYGILIGDIVYIVSSCVSVLQNTMILIAYYYFLKNEKNLELLDKNTNASSV